MPTCLGPTAVLRTPHCRSSTCFQGRWCSSLFEESGSGGGGGCHQKPTSKGQTLGKLLESEPCLQSGRQHSGSVAMTSHNSRCFKCIISRWTARILYLSPLENSRNLEGWHFRPPSSSDNQCAKNSGAWEPQPGSSLWTGEVRRLCVCVVGRRRPDAQHVTG